jgi:O-antigen/teichoic acid export membrane protein
MLNKPWHQLTFVLGEAVLAVASSGLLAIIISRVSGPELFGTYALAFAWLTLFQGLSSFGIPEFIMREVGAHGRDAAGHVVHAMALGLGSGAVAIFLLLCVSRLFGYSSSIVEAIAVASLALIPGFLNTACRSVFLALREMHLTVLVALVEVAIVISANLYLLFSGYGAVELMIALVGAKIISASIAVTLLYRRVLRVRLALDRRVLVRTAKTVCAFGVGNVLGMLSMRINVILASAWADIAAVGHFAAATKVMEVGLMAPNLFAQFLMTRMAYSFNTQGNDDPNLFGAWYRVLFALVLPTCVGGWVFAAPLLTALFGAGFGAASWILRILMIYLLIESVDAVMSMILKAAHRQREDVTLLAFNPPANIALSLILLPIMGTLGAAIGRPAGALVSATLRNALIARKLRPVNWLRFALKPAMISIGLGWLCSLLPGDRPAWLLLLYLVATVACLRLSSSFSFSAIKDMMTLPSLSEAKRARGESEERTAVSRL